jgi:hypothetical protein
VTAERPLTIPIQILCLMRQRLGRLICISLLFAGFVFSSGPIRIASVALGQRNVASDTLAQQIVAKHCRACHGGPEPKGEFNLNSLSLDFTDEDNRES